MADFSNCDYGTFVRSGDEVIEMNVEKLKARYPGGEFDVHSSENRVEGDV